MRRTFGWQPHNEEGLHRWFIEARKRADADYAARVAYLERKLAEGQHPDTHSNFWDAYQTPPIPRLPGEGWSTYLPGDEWKKALRYHSGYSVETVLLVSLCALVLAAFGWAWRRKRALKRSTAA